MKVNETITTSQGVSPISMNRTRGVIQLTSSPP